MANLKITAKKTAGTGSTVTLAGVAGLVLEGIAKKNGIDAPDGLITVASTALLTAGYKGIRNWLKHRRTK